MVGISPATWPATPNQSARSLAEHVLSDTVATAIVAAAVVSLGVCTIGVERMLTRETLTPAGTGLQGPA